MKLLQKGIGIVNTNMDYQFHAYQTDSRKTPNHRTTLS